MNVLQKCFPDKLTDSAWLPKLKQIIPTYGVDLMEDGSLRPHPSGDRARA